MRTRTAPSLETKLAAALLELGQIPFDDAKAMGRTNFLSLWNYDHGSLHSEEGSDEFWNLTPRLIPPHRKKTIDVDIPQIVRNRDVQATEAIHQAKLASKAGDYAGAAIILSSVKKKSRLKPKRKIPGRGFSQGHRPLRSRGFG